jgi:hypothetical protein
MSVIATFYPMRKNLKCDKLYGRYDDVDEKLNGPGASYCLGLACMGRNNYLLNNQFSRKKLISVLT